MWDKYLLEREGKEVYQTDKGFAVYKNFGEEFYFQDIYVHPDFRKTRAAYEIASEIEDRARKAGCKVMTGTIGTKTVGATESLKLMLKFGFKLSSSAMDYIVLIKDL